MEVNPSPAAASAALHPERSGAGQPELQLLPLLRQVCSPKLVAVDLEPVKAGFVADVYRATPRLENGAAQPAPLIVKVIRADAVSDPHVGDREANFYAAVHPRLGFEQPAVYYTGCDPATRTRVVVMQALRGYRNPLRTHRWTPEEARCFVRAYARLHAAPVDARHLEEPWLFRIPPGELTTGKTLEMAADLTHRGIWAPLPNLSGLIEWVGEAGEAGEPLEKERLSYLHGDVFPPNVSLPADLSDEAVLIDWDMAGIGLAELDLAFMFLQPFGSAGNLDRAQVLDEYWRARDRLGSAVPSEDERRLRQHFADALWGLYLIRIAHRSVFDPFPKGSPPDAYWDSMRGVLHRWLVRISESANDGRKRPGRIS